MHIMSNIAAINAHRNLKANQDSKAKAMEKLSSGYRINRAADDAAGLSITEKMRVQINGLHQASRNIQDGISLIQTADGGMQEIHAMLQRMNMLANQASNGTYSNEDRSKLNLEFQQLKHEINAVAENTKFNGIELLNNKPKFNEKDLPIEGEVSVNWSSNIPSRKLSQTTDGGYVGIDDTASVAFKTDSTGNIVWSKSLPSIKFGSIKETSDGGYILVGNDFSADSTSGQKINAIKWDGQLNETWRTGVAGLYSIEGAEIIETRDGSFVLTGVGSGIQNWDGLVVKFNNNGIQVAKSVNGSFDSNPIGYGNDEYKSIVELEDGSFLAVGTSSLKINGLYTEESSWIMKYDSNLNPLWDIRVGSSGDGNGFNAVATSDGGAIIVGSYNDSTKTSGLIYKVDSSGNLLWEKNIADSTNTFSQYTNIVEGEDGHFLVAGTLDNNYHISVYDSEGNRLATFELGNTTNNYFSNNIISNSDGSYTISSIDGITNVNLSIGEHSQKVLKLQVGWETNDTFLVEIGDVRTHKLGINSTSLATSQSANAAIAKLAKAVELVSSERSKFGAYQNALEHIKNNVLNNKENLSAAHSRIRDADMAHEMTMLTKSQIVSEAGTSMLAQANSLPHNILKLLE